MSASPATDIAPFIDFANELADASGAAVLPYFRAPISIRNKLDGNAFDPVTEGDRAAETAIRHLIEKRFPDHGIIGEEFGTRDGTSAYRWVIDPIDGTRAFISGLPLWGTLIALECDGVPVIGIIDQPFLKERFTGTPDGSTLNGTPIRCRQCSGIEKATLSSTTPDMFDKKEWAAFQRVEKAVRMTRFGYDCYAYAMLAHGFMDLVIEADLKHYDVAALYPVIAGAGGIASGWDGAPATSGGRLVAAGNKGLHDAALALLQDG